MKFHTISFFCLFILSLSNVTADEKERDLKQKELDMACETARKIHLAPLRQEYIEECIKKQKKDRSDKNQSDCERFYSDYGNKTGNKAALFYDLPECVEAFDYQKSYRQAK